MCIIYSSERERARETEGALERALDFEIEGGKRERMKAEQKNWGRSPGYREQRRPDRERQSL